MALQLNPNTTDDYESKTLAEMRQMVFDTLGFIDPMTVDYSGRIGPFPAGKVWYVMANMRASIINRLGLAVALLVANDSFATVLADVYNATGYAGQSGTHPPGIDTMLTDYINEAQNTIFRRIQLDKGSSALPTAGVISIDSHAVRMLSIALVKAHKGQPDAQIYLKQYEDYLNDLTQRTPPNIVGQVNAALVAANEATLRRYEIGNTGTFTAKFGASFFYSGDFASTVCEQDIPDVDAHAVQLLALANLKKKVGQADADECFREYEQFMSDTFRRTPPNAVSIVNQTLKNTQQQLYRKYDVFRMERWWTWPLVAGQRFYGLFDSSQSQSLAPTAGVATIGSAVTSHEMSNSHADGIVVALNDGKILVAGGSNASGNTISAELYNQATGKFSTTGSMIVSRLEPMGIKLQDGNVLVCGGVGLKSSELYNASTGTWSAVGDMPVDRYRGAMALLQDGRVIVAGGQNSFPAVGLSSAAIYSPSTQTWTTTGSMPASKTFLQATVLPSGKVLFSGGADGVTFSPTSTSYLYDPAAATFSTTGSLGTARSEHSSILLLNGTVLVIGGVTTGAVYQTSCEVYDPASGSFSSTGSMTHARAQAVVSLLSNEKVLVAGGFDGALGDGTDTADLYDMEAGTFSATGNLPSETVSSTAVVIDSNRVLIPGGYNTLLNTYLTSASIYYIDAGTFSLAGSLTQGTVYYQVTAYTANGESLPGTEFFVSGVPANTSVVITFDPVNDQPFVLGFNIYGRVTGGTKQKIGSITRSQNVNSNGTHYFVDDGTAPPNGALPTQNNTAGPGSIDPRHVTWVGLSFNDNVWNPLIKGIPPMAFAQNINGVPTNYEIRQALEVWPAPTTTDWKVQIKGYFQPLVFNDDNDSTTLDWQAILYQAIADCMPRFKTQKGTPWFTPLEVAQAQKNSTEYIRHLVAGTHMTARYIPGVILQRNAVRPVLSGPYVGYP